MRGKFSVSLENENDGSKRAKGGIEVEERI